MVRIHLPGQEVFRSVRPEDIDWKAFPAFPPSVRLAVLVGRPSKPGPYVIRIQSALWREVDATQTSEDRVLHGYVGVFYIGLGDQFDGDKVEAYPTGSVIVLPGTTASLSLGKVR